MAYLKFLDGGFFKVDAESQQRLSSQATNDKYSYATFGSVANAADFSNTTQVQTHEIDIGAAYSHAFIQSASVVLWVVLIVSIARAWKKPNSPLQMGIKWAAWSGSGISMGYIARIIGVVFLNHSDKESLREIIINVLLLGVIFGFTGFILGWLYGKFFKFKTEPKSTSTIVVKHDDESLYETVANEIEAGDIQKGLWTKAFAQSGGNEAQTKALYIQTRVEQLGSVKKPVVEIAYTPPTIRVHIIKEAKDITVEVLTDGQHWLNDSPNAKQLLPLSKIDVHNLELSKFWWVQGNVLFVYIYNSGYQPLKGLIFSISDGHYNENQASQTMMAMYNFNIQPNTGEVVSSPLPFDYDNLKGQKTKCGEIKTAYVSN